jgi:hypothetical protein
MDHVDHYAEAFTVIPGQCFRMIQGKAGQQGAPTHCPDPVEYRGKFIDAKGKHHEVEACEEHAGDFYEWHWIGKAKVIPIRPET